MKDCFHRKPKSNQIRRCDMDGNELHSFYKLEVIRIEYYSKYVYVRKSFDIENCDGFCVRRTVHRILSRNGKSEYLFTQIAETFHFLPSNCLTPSDFWINVFIRRKKCNSFLPLSFILDVVSNLMHWIQSKYSQMQGAENLFGERLDLTSVHKIVSMCVYINIA